MNKIPVILFFASLSFLGCSGGSSRGNGNGNNIFGEPTSCTPSKQSLHFLVDTVKTGESRAAITYEVVDLFFKGSAPILLAQYILPDETYQITLLKMDGSQQVLASLPKGDERFTQLGQARGFRRNDGTLCAVFAPNSSATVWLACEDGTVENSHVETTTSIGDFSGPLLSPIVELDGTLHVYTIGKFAAYTELVRSKVGQWVEKRKYESSISYATDAILYNQHAISCVSRNGSAFIDLVNYQENRKVSIQGVQVKQCKITAADNNIYVLTEKGFGVLLQSDISASTYGPLKVNLTDLNLPTDTKVLSLNTFQGSPVGVLQRQESRSLAIEILDLKNNIRKAAFSVGYIANPFVKYVESNGSISIVTGQGDFTKERDKYNLEYSVSTTCMKDFGH